jgi:putative transposase
MDALLQSRAEELATEFASQATTVEELNDLMRLMMKRGLERMLDTEMDVHLGRRSLGPLAEAASFRHSPAEQRRSSNRRNGRSRKRVQGDLGEVTLSTPRDREGTFEPQLIEKHQRRVPGFDEKILALYAKGMTTRDIQEIVRELYGVEVSATLVSAITEDLDAEVSAWRTRSLSPVWPIVYFDGITVHVRGASGRVSQHTIYVALGVDLAGQKELLGLWLGENEGAKFWLACLTDLQSRGLRDIFVACIDGLSGFAEAIHAYGRIGCCGREQRFAGPGAEELRAIVHERLRRRFSAPRRIGCSYRLTQWSLAPEFDVDGWVPKEVFNRFQVRESVAWDV